MTKKAVSPKATEEMDQEVVNNESGLEIMDTFNENEDMIDNDEFSDVTEAISADASPDEDIEDIAVTSQSDGVRRNPARNRETFQSLRNKGSNVYQGINDDELDEIADLRTEREKISETWREIVALEASGHIATGKVVGVSKNDATKSVRIQVLYKGFDVIIPDTAFFPEDTFAESYYQSSEEEKLDRRTQRVNRMLGCIIDFVVTLAKVVNSKGERRYVVAGDRLAAMNKMKELTYFNSNRPAPQQGSLVKARILSSGSRGVRVEVYGVESFISLANLSANEWIADASEKYKRGEILIVQILGIQIDETTHQVSLRLSRSACEIADAKKHITDALIGRNFLGTVKGISMKGKYTIGIESPSIKAVVDPQRVVGGVSLNGGDKVSVKITHVFPEEGYVIGRCMKL